MPDSTQADTAPATSTEPPPSDPPAAPPSGFDPLTDLHRAAWVVNPRGVARTGPRVTRAEQPDIDSVEQRPFTEDGTRIIRRSHPGAEMTEQPTPAATPLFSDGLTLERLYARFDAMARGWDKGNSSAAHRSILERLAANQSLAAKLGWSNFLVSRRGGSGRLELRGSRTPGQDRELVPDQIPYR